MLHQKILPSLILSPLLLGTALAMTSVAQTNAPFTSPQTPSLANDNSQANPNQLLQQINSIRQLRDVSPTDWSYDALRNLVENYGCIAGYPDGTYRGNRPLTRNEFAAGLNACLQQLERRFVEATANRAAPTQPPQPQGESLQYVFDRAFFHNTGDFYEITSISGQLNHIFGWRTFPGSYPDNLVSRDGKLLGTIYTDAMQQQGGGPLIRTRDLPNPFDTSVFQNPSYLRTEGNSSISPVTPNLDGEVIINY
jgi:hypothetical protein